MTKTCFAIAAFFFISAHSIAQDAPDSIFTKANTLYEHKQYSEAFELYSKLAEVFPGSIEINYNLGNCAFRMKRYGYAVFYYKKALQADPSDEDVKHNLELTKLYLKDRVAVPPEPALMANLRSFFGGLTTTAMSLLLIALAYIWAILFFLNQLLFHTNSPWRKWPQRIILGALVMTFVWLGVRLSSEQSGRIAVILAESIDIKNDPVAEGSVAFILHEGTVVEIRTEKDDWAEIRLPDGKIGWLKLSQLGLL